MKTILKMTIAISLLTGIYSCKKSQIADPKIAQGAINVTNAVIGGATITYTSSQSIISTDNTLGNNSAGWFPMASGQLTVNFGVPAKAATATAPAVPAVMYYSNTINVTGNSNYSLFLTGTSSAIDNVLIQETYTQTYPDSVCGVRFINLAPGSNPVSVDIRGSANGSEAASLVYKAYSGFNKHPATANISGYTFEFRDAVSGSLLTSYTLNTPYLHNATLCFSGSAGNYGVIEDDDF